jgi:hypothetical protein
VANQINARFQVIKNEQGSFDLVDTQAQEIMANQKTASRLNKKAAELNDTALFDLAPDVEITDDCPVVEDDEQIDPNSDRAMFLAQDMGTDVDGGPLEPEEVDGGDEEAAGDLIDQIPEEITSTRARARWLATKGLSTGEIAKLLNVRYQQVYGAVGKVGGKQALAHCSVCGRPLSNEESVAAGMGPVCDGSHKSKKGAKAEQDEDDTPTVEEAMEAAAVELGGEDTEDEPTEDELESLEDLVDEDAPF